MDMRLYWLRDRSIEQNKFHTHGKRSKHNLGEYPTKHQQSKDHRTVQPLYVTNPDTKFNE